MDRNAAEPKNNPPTMPRAIGWIMLLLGVVGIVAGLFAIPERIPLDAIAGDNPTGEVARSFDYVMVPARNAALEEIDDFSWIFVGARFFLSIVLIVVGWKALGAPSQWNHWVIQVLMINLVFAFVGTGMDIWFDLQMFQALFSADNMRVESQWFALLYLIVLVVCLAVSVIWLLVQVILLGIAMISLLRKPSSQ